MVLSGRPRASGARTCRRSARGSIGIYIYIYIYVSLSLSIYIYICIHNIIIIIQANIYYNMVIHCCSATEKYVRVFWLSHTKVGKS